jgi:hypothetical protein
LSNLGLIALIAQPENEMLAISIIALISKAGIAFCARFLVALWRERKSPRRVYGYCVRLDFDEAKAIDPATEPIPTRIWIRKNNERGTKKGRIDVNPRSCSRATGTTLSSLPSSANCGLYRSE